MSNFIIGAAAGMEVLLGIDRFFEGRKLMGMSYLLGAAMFTVLGLTS